MSLLSIVLILFFIMDPFGNISAFLNMLSGLPLRRQKIVIFREMTIALVAMVLFYFIGEFLLQVLEVSEVTVRLASGVILFLFAIKILFPGVTGVRYNLKPSSGEPLVVPLAIPLIASPSLLATIMLYAHLDTLQPILLLAIFIAWFFACLILLFGDILKRVIGDNGLIASERLMGMILVLLGIQRFLEGIQLFVQK